MVVAKYAVEKVGGSIKSHEENGANYVTISMNSISKDYYLSDSNVVNGRFIIKTSELANDVGMDASQLMHSSDDAFDTPDDAALA